MICSHIETSPLICSANERDLRHERVKVLYLKQYTSQNLFFITNAFLKIFEKFISRNISAQLNLVFDIHILATICRLIMIMIVETQRILFKIRTSRFKPKETTSLFRFILQTYVMRAFRWTYSNKFKIYQKSSDANNDRIDFEIII